MGTHWSVALAQPLDARHAACLTGLVQARLDDLCDQMSHWQPDSLISRINRSEPGWYALPEDFFRVMQTALDLAQSTRGTYDPTLGALSSLWGFGPTTIPLAKLPPLPESCTRAVQRSGWLHTALNHQHRALWQPGGMEFDLSSIAKGYGVDQIADLLNAQGMTDYLVEIGGELKAQGFNSRHEPWRIQIELPPINRSGQAVTPETGFPTSLRDAALATSGNYRRTYTTPEGRFCHTLDPFTGQPVQHALLSVTVVDTTCMMADALATALLVMGPERGKQYARTHHVAALFIHDPAGNDTPIEWTPEFEYRAH
ncbi:MAG: FAD:protein FMN transferase [Alcaligenaceae bacterium]|nr:FAD:protein FMN transferase [Alcaligenaceae bacterium]